MPKKDNSIYEQWLESSYGSQSERLAKYSSISDMEMPPLVTGEQLAGWDEQTKISLPGHYPYTRGIQPTMYRGRLWTMRQFAGFGSPEDTNRRFHYLLEAGQSGLSTAFDMPSLMGYDPDHELSTGEVGREGVSVFCIDDIERLFDGIDLTKVTTSMTINCTATAVLAMYFAVARRRGYDLQHLGGTIQNDILKEYIAQKEWICPVEPGLRLTCDIIEYCATHASRFNPVSISGYHIREAGATAVQELAFTLYDGIAYVEHCIDRGMAVDSFAPRLSFFFDVHNDFFEEIAKLRAARRMWATIMKSRFSAKDTKSLLLRTHCQTAGVSLTAQQPVNNVARVAIQALAAVLGGTQSLHTNALDETLSLPTEHAAKVALRTQQIIAEETGVVNTIDPLGGAYYLEQLTDRLESEAYGYIEKLDELGGMTKAIDQGYPQKELAESAYHYQRQLEEGEKHIVGVTKYLDDDETTPIALHKGDEQIERSQREKCLKLKASRPAAEVVHHLERITEACSNQSNVMPVLIEAVDSGVTLGEISDVYRKVFGEYKDPGLL